MGDPDDVGASTEPVADLVSDPVDSDVERVTEAASGDPGMRRLRRLWGGGILLAGVLALLVGAIGGTGKDGFAVFTLVLALTAVVTGLVGTIGLVRDDLAERPISRGRIAVVVGSFFGSALLMAMVTGVGG